MTSLYKIGDTIKIINEPYRYCKQTCKDCPYVTKHTTKIEDYIKSVKNYRINFDNTSHCSKIKEEYICRIILTQSQKLLMK